MRKYCQFLSVMLLAGIDFPSAALPADRLILRNLDIVTDRTVTAFDEDGLVLDAPQAGGGQRLTWDELERGKVALDQPRFDALLADLGLPLFRIRQRLRVGDYHAAGEVAETLFPRFAERKSQTAYLVCQATMWSRLAEGRREEAVEPYLRCYELLRSRAAASSRLPGTRRLKLEADTALSSELAPVWFDSVAAKKALPVVERVIRTMAPPRPAGVYLYYATLAVVAGEASEAERVMLLLGGEQPAAAGIRDLVRAQQELAGKKVGPAIEQLRNTRDELPESCRMAALLVVGMADARAESEDTCRDGLLSLLTLPAAYGDEQPELAAAALYYAAAGLDKLKDRAGAAAVRGELASRYVGTQYELKMRGQVKP